MNVIRTTLARFREDRMLALIVGLGILGATAVFVLTSAYGARVSPDSTMYVSTASNLVDPAALASAVQNPPPRRMHALVLEYGRLANLPFMLNHYGDALIYWPPLLPAALAAGSLSIFDPLEVGRFANALAFGVTILTAGLWLRSRGVRGPLLALSCVATVASFPLLHVSLWLWSESLFIMLVTLSLTRMATYLGGSSAGARSSLIWAAVFAALACLTRYMGAAIILSAAILLLCRRNAFSPPNLRDAGIFMMVSGAPLSLWLARNFLLSRTLTGSRVAYESEFPLFENVQRLFSVPLSWTHTQGAGNWVVLLQITGAVAIASVALYLVTASRSRDARHAAILGSRSSDPWSGFASIVPFAAFTAVYVGFLMTFLTIFQISPLDSRHLSPIYVPLLITLTVTVHWALKVGYHRDIIDASRRRAARAMARGAVGAAGLIVIGGFIVGGLAYAVSSNNRDELDYASERWVSSGLMEYVKDSLGADGLIYTNARDGVYIHTRLQQANVKRPPRKGSDLAGLSDRLSALDRVVYVAWFHGANTHVFDYGLEEIELALDVERVAEFADGALYRLRRGGN